MRKINRRWCIVAPAMRLAKDTVACLTIVSLGEGLNRRYYQRSSFPSLMPHVETRRGARGSQHRGQPPVFDLFFTGMTHPAHARAKQRARVENVQDA